jgi:tRNA-2-methylthio-N6-dimethylallyladenosine synthase
MSVVEKLNKVNNNIKISSDFIVGYPGETEEDFENTMKLVEKVGFINSYSFIFSPRPGTPAAIKKLNNLEENEIRLKKLQNKLENFQYINNEKYLHQNCEVLIENKLDNQEKYFGRTKYMTPVIFEADNCKIGELASIKITSFNQKNLFGIYKIDKVKAA